MPELVKLPAKEYSDTVNKSANLRHCAQLRGSAGSSDGCGNRLRELEDLGDPLEDSCSTAKKIGGQQIVPVSFQQYCIAEDQQRVA